MQQSLFSEKWKAFFEKYDAKTKLYIFYTVVFLHNSYSVLESRFVP